MTKPYSKGKRKALVELEIIDKQKKKKNDKIHQSNEAARNKKYKREAKQFKKMICLLRLV